MPHGFSKRPLGRRVLLRRSNECRWRTRALSRRSHRLWAWVGWAVRTVFKVAALELLRGLIGELAKEIISKLSIRNPGRSRGLLVLA